MKELEEQLQEMAKRMPSGDGQREESLEDAEKGLGEAEKQLGMPMPMNAGAGSRKGDKDGNGGEGNGGKGNGARAGRTARGGPGDGGREGRQRHAGALGRRRAGRSQRADGRGRRARDEGAGRREGEQGAADARGDAGRTQGRAGERRTSRVRARSAMRHRRRLAVWIEASFPRSTGNSSAVTSNQSDRPSGVIRRSAGRASDRARKRRREPRGQRQHRECKEAPRTKMDKLSTSCPSRKSQQPLRGGDRPRHRRAGRRRRADAVGHPRGRSRPPRGRARARARRSLVRTIAGCLDLAVLAHPVHAGSHAERRDRHQHPGHRRRRLAPLLAAQGADLRAGDPGRRDQPGHAEDAERAARGDAGARVHHRGHAARDGGAVLRAGHREPDRDGRAPTRCRRRSSIGSCSRSSCRARPRTR